MEANEILILKTGCKQKRNAEVYYKRFCFKHFGTKNCLFYRQALELIESAVGPEHLRVAQELGALSRIARKAGRQKAAESLHRRELAIAAKSAGHVTVSKWSFHLGLDI